MQRKPFFGLLICSILILGALHTVCAEPSHELAVQPDALTIGTFYSGGRITISGQVPEGQNVFVQVAGPTSNAMFDIKARVGPFWMTRDKAEVSGAPVMYVLLLPGGEQWQAKASELGLDLRQLGKHIELRSNRLPPDKLFDMFLDLKKSEGLYMVEKNAVTYASAENGNRRFTAVCHFPRSTATGQYTIKATAVSGSGVSAEQSANLDVREIGFTRMVDDMATHKRLLYGILAVIIALFTGGVMGVLFKGGGGH